MFQGKKDEEDSPALKIALMHQYKDSMKVMKGEGDGNINYNWRTWNSQQKFGKELVE